ncbi:MAG TPA: OmpA family protein [Candidatus Krumholzibacteria bacterium]|nr:OmpA family protein [Candidatus Krumholzibacteria bacterium]
MNRTVILLLSGTLLVAGTGCASNNAAKGGAIGGAAGGVAGGVIGHQSGNTAVGAIIGAAVGGATGAIIGHEMDKRAAEIDADLAGARIERVGEGIKITFDSGLLFDFDKSDLRPEAKTNIANLSKTLNKYADTDIVVEGDTDNAGTSDYNVSLSDRRAKSVSNHMVSLGVSGSRISDIGLGETNPVASNDTDAGRQQNRRVEVAIFANDKLKSAAEKQAGLK